MIKQLALSVFLLSSGFLHADAPDAKERGKEITATIKAVYVPDYDLLLKHTHEEVFKLAGGKESFLETLKKTHEFLKSKNVSIAKVEISEELDYFKTEQNEFFFVASKITLKVGEKTHVAPGHQLGVKKKGSDVWKYIDRSALNDELIRKMFPDFPEDKALPKQ